MTGHPPAVHARAKFVNRLAASIAIIALPMFTVSFLYFPVEQRLHLSAYGSNPEKHVQSRSPVPPTGPNEFAVHALHVVLRLNPALW